MNLNLSELIKCFRDVEKQYQQPLIESPVSFELRNSKICLLNEGKNDVKSVSVRLQR